MVVIEAAQELIDAVAEGLPRHLEARVVALGLAPDSVEGSILDATGRAVEGLTALLACPFDRQPEAPLEVVRRATSIVGEELDRMGVEPPGRDAEQERVAPDDLYGLAPASPAELGDRVLGASLAWGLEKTRHIARPLALVVTTNLMDGSRFEEGIGGSGYRVEVRRDATASTRPVVAFVDLEHRDADETVRSLAGAGVRVIAYGPHVDDHALVRAKTLGAAGAEPRSRVLRDPSAFLPPLV